MHYRKPPRHHYSRTTQTFARYVLTIRQGRETPARRYGLCTKDSRLCRRVIAFRRPENSQTRTKNAHNQLGNTVRLAVYTVQSRKTTNKRSDTNKYVISICPIWKFAENLSLLILLLLLSSWLSDAVVFGFCSFRYFCDVKSSPALSVGRE